eukprot:1144350-Pelagomonas_calceolata.AAC.1
MPAPRPKQRGLIDHLASQAAAKPVNSGVSLNKLDAEGLQQVQQMLGTYYAFHTSMHFKTPVQKNCTLPYIPGNSQAACYERAGVEEQEYVMLMRFASSKDDHQTHYQGLTILVCIFCSLMLETIPKHKDFNAKDAQHLQLKQVGIRMHILFQQYYVTLIKECQKQSHV